MTFRDIIALWGERGGPAYLYKDLKWYLKRHKVKPITIHTVRYWKTNNYIPYKYWESIIEAAKNNRYKIDGKMLKMEMFQEAHNNRR